MTRRHVVWAGAVLGLLYGSNMLVAAYSQAPGPPGPFELAVQALFVAVFVGVGAGTGLLLGWLVASLRSKR